MVKYQDILILFDYAKDDVLLVWQQKEMYEKHLSRADNSVHVRTVTIKTAVKRDDIEVIKSMVNGISNSRIVFIHRKYIRLSLMMVEVLLSAPRVFTLTGPNLTREWLTGRKESILKHVKGDAQKRAAKKDVVRNVKVRERVVHTDFMGHPVLGQLPKGMYDLRDGKVAERRKLRIMMREKVYAERIESRTLTYEAKMKKYREGNRPDIFTMATYVFPVEKIMKSKDIFYKAWAFAKTNGKFSQRIQKEKSFAYIIFYNTTKRPSKMLPIFREIIKKQEEFIYGSKGKRSDNKNRVAN